MEFIIEYKKLWDNKERGTNEVIYLNCSRDGSFSKRFYRLNIINTFIGEFINFERKVIFI